MIKAARSEWFNRWFSRQAGIRIGKSFDKFCVRGIPRLREYFDEGGVLCVANHTAWWDPLVPIFLFTQVIEADGYAMMDAKNLRKLPYLGKVGAFGVDLDDPADGTKAMRYSVGLLKRPRAVVWIFPQGTQRPITERPLRFRQGAAAIARIHKTRFICPVGIRYEFGEDPRPSMYVSVGEAFEYTRDLDAATAQQERAVEEELERLERVVRDPSLLSSEGFETLITHPPSWMDRMAERCLAWFASLW